MSKLNAYRVDDDDYYAAHNEEEASRLAALDWGVRPSVTEQLTDAELDREVDEYDEDEKPTGRKTTLRVYLNEMTEPGWLAGSSL